MTLVEFLQARLAEDELTALAAVDGSPRWRTNFDYRDVKDEHGHYVVEADSRHPSLEQAAHIYGEADNACFSWGLGVTEHKYGSEVVQLICNVALMTGKNLVLHQGKYWRTLSTCVFMARRCRKAT